jgi:hypothetical protein
VSPPAGASSVPNAGNERRHTTAKAANAKPPKAPRQVLSETETPKRFEIIFETRDARLSMGDPIMIAAVMTMSRTVLASLENLGDIYACARVSEGPAISANLRLPRLVATTVLAHISRVLRRSRNNLPRIKRAPPRKLRTIGEASCTVSQSAFLSLFPRTGFFGFI